MVRCPDCDADIPVSHTLQLNEVLKCPDCKQEWEVINQDPVELALAPEVEEDWGE